MKLFESCFQKHLSPIVQFKQPEIVQSEASCSLPSDNSQVLPTPPYPKRWKSELSPKPMGQSEIKNSMLCKESDYRVRGDHTPRSSDLNRLADPPGAPRKLRYVSPSSTDSDEALFVPTRRLSFGADVESNSEPLPLQNWDDFDLGFAQPRKRSSPRSRVLLKIVSLICASGLEAMGQCSMTELKQCLKHVKIDNLLWSLSNLDSRWIQVSKDHRVIFPGEISVAEVIRSINSTN